MANATLNPRTRFLGYGACAFAGTLWGTGFYFGRLALNEMSVEYMVLYRFAFACLGMLPIALINLRHARLSRGEWKILLLSAFFGIPVQFLIQFHGLARTTVSHASLMVGSMPVLLGVAAAIFAGERLGRIGWLALIGSTVGVVLIVSGNQHSNQPIHAGPQHPTLTGDLLVVLSLITALAWVLLSKKLMETHRPIVVTAYTILTGSLMLAVWIIGSWIITLSPLAPVLHAHGAPPPFAHISLTAWVALAIGGLACTATTTLLWNWGIHHVPASRAGVFLNIEPALGSILGVKLLGEHLGPFAWLGGALILGAAIILTTHGHEPEIILE